MTVAGNSKDWVGLIDSMVPDILNLIIETWEKMPSPGSDHLEDDITITLCRALIKNKNARELMFQIRPQVVELDPLSGEDFGRMDIAFLPPSPREDIYFCLESKRLNVVKDGKRRSYASEYVKFGMIRFVTGQYSSAVRHGGMIGYVLDGNISRAFTNVEANIKKRHIALRMKPPGEFFTSSVLKDEARARETHHQRAHEAGLFCIHHLFMTSNIP